ncbi:heterokaryon incompatibility protein-domain-containing protein [Lophiotrema nucula]|uniref:Heterokaryon incompatibility protein-domain-containing protein n=1 Tax=Lophiotrema nucula TaxID=690887 RepID=A0A6A5YV36_9PLEO|nr:heterokaryon incompatibility protein-domain-containing protein [Lophiotrema nucula]
MGETSRSIPTASSRPARYIYKPLRESGQIRTLVIHPTSSRIECSIRNRKHKTGGYHALSYGWGSEERPFEAVVVGLKGKELGYIPLTKNLRDALCDLRETKELGKNMFWIDQICINQEDSNEKNTQVAMMRSIYQNANGVIVYLGAAVDISQEERGLKLLQTLWSYYKNDLPKVYHSSSLYDLYLKAFKGEVKALLQKLEELGIDKTEYDISTGDWNWLYGVCSGEWTQRLWMVQEQLLNGNTVMLRGRHVLSWESLAGISLLASILDIFPQELSIAFRRQKSNDGDPKGLLHALYFLAGTRYRMATLNPEHEFTPTAPLRGVMQYLRALQCRDPRDRVYALMSVSGDTERLGIVPDYSESNTALRLSLHLTQRLIELNINTLIDVCTSRPPNAATSSPSWVLSLVFPDDFSPPFTFDEVFRPHPYVNVETNTQFDLESTPPTMTVRGRILDTTSTILTRTVADEDGTATGTDYMANICSLLSRSDLSDDVLSSLAHALLWLNYRSATVPFTAEDSAYYIWCLFKEYISTPGISDEVSRKCAELIPRLASLCPYLRGLYSGPEDAKFEATMLPAIRTSMEGRSLCYTEAGRFCNTMHDAKPLDSIAAFQGANSLYVLRQAGERYRLVGDAYVSGLMWSEAYEDLNYEEVDYDIELI